MFLDFDIATPASEIYPKEIFRQVDKDLHLRKFIIVLFIITRIWKQLRCSGGKNDG